MSKVWFITGAGRGMGVDIAKGAVAAGHKVVATGRNTDRVAEALGKSASLLIGKLDITKPADADSAGKRPSSGCRTIARSPAGPGCRHPFRVKFL
jgi:NAD(P)-dependent dehydrogenase (short-subunit alcohol dehydrogenase family)